MDYKKILAATAVTSAAIVVPVVVQAAEEATPYDDLIAEGSYTYGNILKSSKEEIVTEEVTDKIVSYEWTHGTVTIVSTLNTGVPVQLNWIGQTIQLTVTTESGKKYTDSVKIAEFANAGTTFKEVTLDEAAVITAANVETTIQATGYRVPNKIGDADQYVNGFQWYIEEDGNYKELTGETDEQLDIPFKLQGKNLVFVIRTSLDNYYASSIKVNPVELDSNSLAFDMKVNGKVGNPANLVPGDVLSIDKITIKDTYDKPIPAAQYDVKYQWYSVNENETVVLLKNATGASYTIPTTSQTDVTYRVDVTATVSLSNDPLFKTAIFSGKVNTDIELQGFISNLLKDNKYSIDNINMGNVTDDEIYVTNFKQLTAYVNALNGLYNELAANRKQFVTNYAILQQATSDVQAYGKFDSQLQQFEEYLKAYNAATEEISETKHAELLKKFATLKTAYNKLTAKQKSIYSLDHDVTLSEYIALKEELLNKSKPSDSSNSSDADYITYSAIDNLNNDILALFDNSSDYLNKSEYVLLTDEDDSLLQFVADVKQLSDEVKKIAKTYQPLIYTSILKMAQSDAKKAQAVVEKIQKIANANDSKKKATAFVAAQKSFDKLTTLQSSLVYNYTDLTLEEDPADDTTNEAIEYLIEDIGALQPYTSSDIETLKSEIEEILVEYKFLSTAERKLVTNYKLVNTVKKDVSAAEKVVKAFEAAEALEVEASDISTDNSKAIVSKLKSAKSKYQSAYKSYIKLTPSVRELVLSTLAIGAGAGAGAGNDPFVGDIDTIINDIDLEIESYNEKDPIEGTEGVSPEEIVETINSLEYKVTTISQAITISEAEVAIEALKTNYKKLNSAEKKKVYNYSTINVVNAHVSKASSVEKKIQAALGTNSLSKLNSALKAYEKLTEPQQKLVGSSYTLLTGEIADIKGDQPDASIFAAFVADAGEFSYDYETIAETMKDNSAYSPKELKAIATTEAYKAYEAAIKDKKAVDSFVAKLKKLDTNPTYSKKQSILTSFDKLTKNQSRLFLSIVDGETFGMEMSPVDLLEGWITGLTSKTNDLNSFIGNLVVESVYKKDSMDAGSTEDLQSIGSVTGEGLQFIESFNMFLINIEAAYKKLDSKEKKLVTHYKMISQMKKDSKAVAAVVKLADIVEKSSTDKNVAYDKYKVAYDKLTSQQQSLFDLAVATPPSLD